MANKRRISIDIPLLQGVKHQFFLPSHEKENSIDTAEYRFVLLVFDKFSTISGVSIILIVL